MAAQRFVSLRMKLLALVVISTLPAAVLLITSAADRRDEGAREVRADAQRLTQLVAANATGVIEAARDLLTTLAAVPEVQNRDARGCRRLLMRLVEGYEQYLNFGAANGFGELFCSARDGAAVTIADRAYFRQALHSREFAVGEYQVGRLTGRPSINFGMPILGPRGEVRGVVFAALDLSQLQRIMESVKPIPPSAAVFFVDRGGTILARVPDAQRYVGREVSSAPVVRTVLRDHSGVRETPGLDGVRRVFAFTRVAASDGTVAGYVGVGIPRAQALARVNARLTTDLLLLALVAAIALALAWVMGHWLVARKMAALVNVTERIAGGDLAARTGMAHGGDEFGRLAAALDKMASSIQTTTEEHTHVHRRAEEVSKRAQGLSEASRLLMDPASDVDESLRVIARLASDLVGDGCVIALVQPDGTIERAAAHHPVREAQESLEHLLSITERPAEGLLGSVLASGEPLLMPAVAPEQVRDALRPEGRDYVDRFGLSGILVLPIRDGGSTVGALVLWRDGGGLPYDQIDIAFAGDLAERVGMALAHVRALETLRAELVARRRAEVERRVTEQRLRVLLDNVQDVAIFMLSDDGNVVTWSAGAEQAFGWPAREALGQPLACFWSNGDDRAALARAIADGRFAASGSAVRRDGSTFSASVVVAPIREEGRVRGFSCVVRPVEAQTGGGNGDGRRAAEPGIAGGPAG